MYLFKLAYRFLFLIIFASESGCLGLKNQAFWHAKILQKSTFAEVRYLIDSNFRSTVVPLELVALEGGLKFDD